MKNNMQRVIGNIVILTPVIVGLVFYNQLPIGWLSTLMWKNKPMVL